MEFFTTVKRLREMVVSHDRAVQQMILLGSKIAEVDKRRRLIKESNTCADDVSLSLRQQVMEGVLEAYKMYRLIKWGEIQTLIAIIFNTYDPAVVHYVLQIATFRRDLFVDSESDSEEESFEDSDYDSEIEAMIEDSADLRIQY